jgi:DNA-binding LytR/AlgR family response regulator
LIKPFSKEELYSSIEIALHNFSTKSGDLVDENLIIKEAIFIKNKGFFTKVSFNDILYLKSDHVYVEIILHNQQKYVVRTSLNDILSKLNNNFIRVHRGFVINVAYLSQINSNSVKIIEEEIPIGKKFREDIVRRINLI